MPFFGLYDAFRLDFASGASLSEVELYLQKSKEHKAESYAKLIIGSYWFQNGIVWKKLSGPLGENHIFIFLLVWKAALSLFNTFLRSLVWADW